MGAFVVCFLVLFVCLCFAGQKIDPGGAKDNDVPGHVKRKLLTVPVGPLGVITNAIIQPTTFLRVALLILRNQLGANPTEEFLQMILQTDLGYTKFTNVFASFAAGAIQDFSSGVTTDTVLAQEWVIDGSSTLDNTVFSEFFAGGAVGIEQFFGFGFEASAAAAMAIQQTLQPKDLNEEYEYEYSAETVQGAGDRRRRRLLSAKEAKARKLPEGAEVITQVRHPLHPKTTRELARRALLRRNSTEAADANRGGRRLSEDAEFSEITYDDVEAYTTNFFESMPGALPLAIRDRFISLLEEFVVDPQIRISLDVTVALVGVATPGVGITSYEAAAENTISNQIVFHGYDAGIDVASSIDPAVAVAASVSKGVAVANAINDATKVIDAVKTIVNEVNTIVEEDLTARDATGDDGGEVSAQFGPSGDNETLTERVARWIRPLKNGTEVRGPRGVDTSRAMHFTSLGKNTSVDANETSEYEDYGGGDGRAGAYFDYVDYEPVGATSGTYAIAVSLIFLEQIALNGGSITVI